MKLAGRAAFVLALLGGASAAQARPSIGVVSGGCGSPKLSRSVNVPFVMGPKKSCVSFINDVGTVDSITLELGTAFPFMEAMAESEMTALKVSGKGRIVELSGHGIAGPELAIRIRGLEKNVRLIVRRYKARPPGQ